MFGGEAEYETIAAVKAAVRIPIIANGDVETPAKAHAVLDATQADGLMIGRGALGNPWVFREVVHHLATGETLPLPSVTEIHAVLLAHLDGLYAFYGERTGVSMARKHIGWYTKGLPDSAAFRHRVFQIPTVAEQRAAVDRFFRNLPENVQLRAPARTLAA
jgi:tRNA-dihydrouridine synthase B